MVRIIISQTLPSVCRAAGNKIDNRFVIREPNGDSPKVMLVGHGRILSANEIRGYSFVTARAMARRNEPDGACGPQRIRRS